VTGTKFNAGNRQSSSIGKVFCFQVCYQTSTFELWEACYPPARVTSSNSFPVPGKLLSILLASVALVADAPAASQSTRATPHSTAQFEALPLIRSRQNHLLVRAFINNKPALLTVDTGAPFSAIALNRRKYFHLTEISGSSKLPPGLQVNVNGALNNVAIARNLRLGALNIVDEPVVLVDLGGTHHPSRVFREQATDGLLGADILLGTEAILDCQQQLLILKMDPQLPGHAPGYDYRGFNAVPIQVSDGFNPYVNAAINGAPAKLMVDTGAFTTLLHRSFVRQMKIPMRETRFVSGAVNLKERGVQVARIRKLSVGSVDILDKSVGVIDLEGLIHNGLLHASPPVAGLLGAEILNRHHGIIDFGTRTLYLKR
jgi:predicted aspartyl protease